MYKLWNAGTCNDDYVEVTMAYARLIRWEGGKGIRLESTMGDPCQYKLHEIAVAHRDFDAAVALMREATGCVGNTGEEAFSLRTAIFG
jgi:hypothetical protein